MNNSRLSTSCLEQSSIMIEGLSALVPSTDRFKEPLPATSPTQNVPRANAFEHLMPHIKVCNLTIMHLLSFRTYYRPPTKLRDGNVFQSWFSVCSGGSSCTGRNPPPDMFKFTKLVQFKLDQLGPQCAAPAFCISSYQMLLCWIHFSRNQRLL